MASKNFKGRIKHTRDTSANWEAKNPVLLAGEVILVDTAAGELRSKTGDGTKRYSQLPFDDEVIRNLINNSKYTHPSHNTATSGLYKITVDALGHVSAVTKVTKADITDLGIPGQDTNTTYSPASTSADGLMSKEDKTKLTGIATGAEVNVQSDWGVTDTASDAFIKNKPDLSVYAKKSEYLPLAGGTMTGNLTVGQSKIQTNGYVVGTWLQATAGNALSTRPPRICVQDSSGWIYSRTPDQILGDIGATRVQLITWEATD